MAAVPAPATILEILRPTLSIASGPAPDWSRYPRSRGTLLLLRGEGRLAASSRTLVSILPELRWGSSGSRRSASNENAKVVTIDSLLNVVRSRPSISSSEVAELLTSGISLTHTCPSPSAVASSGSQPAASSMQLMSAAGARALDPRQHVMNFAVRNRSNGVAASQFMRWGRSAGSCPSQDDLGSLRPRRLSRLGW